MMYLKSVLPNACAVLVRRGCAGGLCGGLCGILGVVRGLGRGASNPVQLEAPTWQNVAVVREITTFYRISSLQDRFHLIGVDLPLSRPLRVTQIHKCVRKTMVGHSTEYNFVVQCLRGFSGNICAGTGLFP